jgi:hypothetical protein
MSTGPDFTGAAGFVEMEYTGSIEGTLSVVGDLHLDNGRAARRPFAAAGMNAKFPDRKLTVTAFQPIGDSDGIFFALTVPDAAGSVVEIRDDCEELACASMLLVFGVGPNAPQQERNTDVDRTCWIDAGTLTITMRTADRVRGLFSGVGSCVFDARTDPVTEFVVEQGSFDVGVAFAYRPQVELY